MNILFPYLARWHSANWTRYHHLLSALARRGHHVVVLQPPPLHRARETNYLEVEERPVAGVEVREFPLPAVLWGARLPLEKPAKKGLAALRSRSEIRRLCAERHFDVLLLYHLAHSAVVGAEATTVVVDVADDLLAMLAHEVPAGLRPAILRVARAAFRRLLGAADVVTTPSDVLAGLLGHRAHVIPNGADLEAVAAADGTRIRSAFRSPLIGYVGAFEYFIDFDLVLETAARLPQYEFVLVGGGRLWPRVRDAVRRRGLAHVHLPGPVPYHEALDYMASFDVALLPFVPGPVADAASPLKLFEYLALGRPVVSTPAAEVARIATDWVSFGATPDAWVDRIRAVQADPGSALRRARAGQEEVRRRYRWDLVAGDLEALIQLAAAQRRVGVAL